MSKNTEIFNKLLSKPQEDYEIFQDDIPDDTDFNPSEHSHMLRQLKLGDSTDSKSLNQRTELVGGLREHGICPTNKLSVTDLLSNKSKAKREVSRLITSHKPSEPAIPLNQRKRIERQALYRRARDEVEQWQSTVDSNRKAEQLCFPLEHVSKRRERVNVHNLMKCENQMEKEIKEVLEMSEDTVKSALSLTDHERAVMKAMDVESARKMQNELARLRSLQERYEKKARWTKKIKSKSYRKLNRVEKRREEEKSLERLKEEDPEEFSRRVLALKADRMEERMTLRHSASTKFAHNQKMYSKYNESARLFVQNMSSAKRRLVEKTPICEEEAEMNRCLDETNVYRPVLEGTVIEDWLDSGKANVQVELEKSTCEERPVTKFSGHVFDSSVPELSATVTKPSINYDDIAGTSTRGGDFEETFTAEKRDIEDGEKEPDIDMYLPGWNAWAGPSIKADEKRQSQYLKKTEKPKRRDRGLGNVIISEKQPTLTTHRVKHVPFPFMSVAQFESSIRTPIDRTWVAETAFRKMIRPRVVTKSGTIIRPICKKATLPSKT